MPSKAQLDADPDVVNDPYAALQICLLSAPYILCKALC